jgi:hypothetical protein
VLQATGLDRQAMKERVSRVRHRQESSESGIHGITT